MEKAWTKSLVRGPWATLVQGGPQIGPWQRLTEARPSGRSGPWWLAARVATRRGRGCATGEPLTRAWTTVRRLRNGSRASAQKGDDVGAVELRRGHANGCGSVLSGWGSFYRAGGGVPRW
jgi:hypothetical protein